MTASEATRLGEWRDPDAIAVLLAPDQPLQPLLKAADQLRREGHGDRMTYSPKVFIPLTQLCRDNCGYCTFAQPPRPVARAYMTVEETLS